MSTADNEAPAPATPLRVGLIADTEEVSRYTDAIGGCARLELCAVAGMARDAVPKDLAWFDDTRVLIAQTGVNALVIGSSPRVGVALGELAAEHGVHVWRPPPLGRNFAEAVEVTRRLKTSETVYRIASWWEHVEALVRWAMGVGVGFEPVFSEVGVSAAGPGLPSWRSSQGHAGGGVLAQDGYASLEALIAIRGLPETVAGMTARCRAPSAGAPRETEDVATTIMQYEDGGVACVRAVWDLPPPGQSTLHHGREISVRFDATAVAVLDREGNVLEKRALPGGFLAAEMGRLAGEIADRPDRAVFEAVVSRHLAVSALLEATYLSARTGHPEIPRRLFEVQKWPEPER
jgi:predicted dehydrogenase